VPKCVNPLKKHPCARTEEPDGNRALIPIMPGPAACSPFTGVLGKKEFRHFYFIGSEVYFHLKTIPQHF
jgi:hypothetical protein